MSERLGLRPDVFPLDLVGQGCGAALPNWRAAEALLVSGRAGRVLGSVPVIDSHPLLPPVPGFYPLLPSRPRSGELVFAANFSPNPRS